MEQDINHIIEEYGHYEWQYLKTKEDLMHLWSLDIMAYAICWPGAQGSPGVAYFHTDRGFAFAIDYCHGELEYDDLRSILPDLPTSFEELRPWEVWKTTPYLPKEMEKFGKLNPWDFDGYQNIGGWYWYGLHSGFWARIHESIWPNFYMLAAYDRNVRINRYWGTVARKAIADRSEHIGSYLSGLVPPEYIHECSEEEAQEVARLGVVAWRETDQGWGGLLCKNGKAYFRLDLDFNTLPLPVRQREEIRNNTLTGWYCYYCGLGHRLMIREEYYPKFRELTYGLGKNADLFNNGFNILRDILELPE